MGPPDAERGPAANEAPHDQPVERIGDDSTRPPVDPGDRPLVAYRGSNGKWRYAG